MMNYNNPEEIESLLYAMYLTETGSSYTFNVFQRAIMDKTFTKRFFLFFLELGHDSRYAFKLRYHLFCESFVHDGPLEYIKRVGEPVSVDT